MSSKYIFAVLIVMAVLVSASFAQTRTFYVSPEGSDKNIGYGSWLNAKQTIGAAINDAAKGEQIWVAAGLYNEAILVQIPLRIYGGFAGTEKALDERPPFPRPEKDPYQSAISGNKQAPGVTINSEGTSRTLRLDGFTINLNLGGIAITNSSPLIINNNIIENSSLYGSGILVSGGAPYILNNIITLNGSSDNEWDYGGGGICCLMSSPIIMNNIITNNISITHGGGIFLFKCEGIIANNIIAQNHAEQNGGGIHCNASPVAIINNTIANNANEAIMLIECGGNLVANNIIAFNSTGISNNGGAPIVRFNDVLSYLKNYINVTDIANDIEEDPLFANPDAVNYHIEQKSRCINAGSDSYVRTGWTDIDGEPRIMGGRADMGADEFPLPDPTPTPSPTPTPTPSPSPTPTPTPTPTPEPTPVPHHYWFEDFQGRALDIAPPEPAWDIVRNPDIDFTTTLTKGLLRLSASKSGSWGGVANERFPIYRDFSLHTKFIFRDRTNTSGATQQTEAAMSIRFRTQQGAGYSLTFKADDARGVIELSRTDTWEIIQEKSQPHSFFNGEVLFISIDCLGSRIEIKVGTLPGDNDVLDWSLMDRTFVRPGYFMIVNYQMKAADVDYVYAGTSGWNPIHPPHNEPPRIVRAIFSDTNNDDLAGAGDNLTLAFDQGVTITKSLISPKCFYLPVRGDTLGGRGFSVGMSPFSSRHLVLTLGSNAHLTIPGDFLTTMTENDSPSGIDLAAELPIFAIYNEERVMARDNGVPHVNDAGVDIRFGFRKVIQKIGSEGGVINIPDDADSVYKKHALVIPRNSISASNAKGERLDSVIFEVLPPPSNLSLPGALFIRANAEKILFLNPATLIMEYLDNDLDPWSGFAEEGMRINRLIGDSPNTQRWVRIMAPQFIDKRDKIIWTKINTLAATTPIGGDLKTAATGDYGIFGNLPGSTIEENTIYIRPQSRRRAVLSSAPSLSPKSGGYYTIHQIEFPNFEEALPGEPGSTKITIKSSTLLERVSRSGGNSFPTASSALFSIATFDSSNIPVPFDAPVNIRVQFMDGSTNAFKDILQFDGQPGEFGNMAIVKDFIEGNGVNFQFVQELPQTIGQTTGGGYVEATGATALTDGAGKGTWGAVAQPPVPRLLWMLR